MLGTHWLRVDSLEKAPSNGPLARYVKLRVAHAPGMPGTFSSPPQNRYPGMHHGTCVTHVPWCMPGSLTCVFPWSWWRGKRSRQSRRMRNTQFYVSGKRPMLSSMFASLLAWINYLETGELRHHCDVIIMTSLHLPRPQDFEHGVQSVQWEATQSTGHGIRQSSSPGPMSVSPIFCEKHVATIVLIKSTQHSEIYCRIWNILEKQIS